MKTSFLFFLLLVLFYQVQGQSYEISSQHATSTEAHKLCRELATPGIDDKGKANIDHTNIAGTVEEGDALWIGYARKYKDFAYIGCALKHGLPENDAIGKDIGKCYSMCMSTYIGVEIDKCYCLSTLPDIINHPECDETCSHPKDALCGKPDKAMSIYMAVQHQDYTEGENDPSLCLSYGPPNGSYVWDDCSRDYRVLCQNESKNGNLRSYSAKGKWRENMDTCISSENSYPPQARDDIHTMNLDKRHWMGKIRTYKSVESTHNSSDDEGFRQGFVQVRRGKGGELKFHLKFDPQDGPLSAICNEGTQITKPSTNTYTGTSSSEGPHMTASSTDPITEISQNTMDTTTNGSFTSSNEKQSGTSLVAVYVVLPILVLIALIMAIVCIIRKRTVEKRKEAGLSEYNSTVQNNAGTANAVANSSYQDGDIHNDQNIDAIRHDYFALEPSNEYASIKDTDLGANVTDEYDTANNFHDEANKHGKVSGNVYNTLSGVAERTGDDTYNHTGDDANSTVYNTTETLSKSNTVASGAGNSKNNHPVDTYSHLQPTSSHTFTCANTDDTYNHTTLDMRAPNQVADTYAHVKPV